MTQSLRVLSIYGPFDARRNGSFGTGRIVFNLQDPSFVIIVQGYVLNSVYFNITEQYMEAIKCK